MNWINIHTDTLRDSVFIGAEPLERATWICLLGWSCTQENGGVIEGCKDWQDRRWQQTCGVTKEEVENGCDLFFFKGNDLVITYYPIDHENTVKARREGGKKGGRPIHSKTKNLKDNLEVIVEDKQNITLKKDKVSKVKVSKVKIIKSNKAFIPPEYQEFEDYLKEALPQINPEWSISRIMRASKLQYQNYQESDINTEVWRDGNGKLIKNWKLSARNSLKYQKPWQYGSDQATKPHQSANYVTQL